MAIQSVKRATDIISLFSSSQPALGITQIAAALGLNKATAWGLVTTLEKQGFLQQDPETLKYGIGSKLFELGMVYFSNLEINAKSSRLAQGLANRTGVVTRVGVWDSGSILITLVALPKSEDNLSHQLGPRVPAYCSGIGKAVLPFLDPEEVDSYLRDLDFVRHARATILNPEELRHDMEQTRERGYAISSEEMIPGLAALGAPVFGRSRRVVGGISLSDTPANLLGKNKDTLADDLLHTAAEISRKMGYYTT
ncbi:IclR family transcriptional regulator [Geobacter sp. AOG1]|uniref:IclR family transcriptional regulator n=1 Tax=Geobacter sp. AOG1 TaxID=1566346 RepID=UPI001CC794CC|nr:IclR family transcriptional regulator [Geobacter sp. AOG1]GFE57348.1 IclR family transcriptional regulator [Geobacter sp. AOG1]